MTKPDSEKKSLESVGAGDEVAGTLSVDPELEAALREAADAVDARLPGAASSAATQPILDPEPAPAAAAAPDAAPASNARDVEVEELSAQLVDAKDQMLRLQADFDNFRRRALKEHTEAVQYGHQNLVKDLLSAVDNLARAISHARESEGGDLQGLLQGVELVEKELTGALKKHGIEKVSAMGKLFDPALHEAMAQAPDASVAPNTVTAVYQEGYKLRDRLIRAARVVVAKAPDGEKGGGGDST